MGKLMKFIAAFLIVVIVIVGGLAVFVKSYLTEDRLKAIIVPRAESALGREVSIGGIEVSLLSGITVRDFVIRESGGRTDFVRAGAFVLRYDFMPLLSGKLEIGKLLLDEPFVRIVRDKKGRFNYETLAILSASGEAPEPEAKTANTPLPVALSVQGVAIRNARVEIRDELGEIPEVDGTATLALALDMGKDLNSLVYSGDLDFRVDLRHGDLAPSATGTVKVDMERLVYETAMGVEDQKLTVSGEIVDYRTAPRITLAVASKALSIDRLLALASALPDTTEPPGAKISNTPPGAKKGPVGEAIPEGMTINGSVKIDRSTYKDLALTDFVLNFALKQGILSIDPLSVNVADGSLASTATANLKQEKASFKGDLKLDKVQLAGLVAGLAPKAIGTLEGGLRGDFAFNGRGTTWEDVRPTLNVEGDYGADNLVIRAPVSEAVAGLLGLQELRELRFDTSRGNIRVENGVVRLKSVMEGKQASVVTTGNIGLDGKLDLPVALTISEELGKKARGRTQVAQYVIKEKGPTTLNIKIAGTLSKPRPALDEKAVQKKIEEEAFKKLGEILSNQKQKDGKQKEGAPQNQEKADPAGDLIKGIFGN